MTSILDKPLDADALRVALDDIAIITQTASLYGPPFVPPVASALNNPAMLLSGLTTGLVGYAVGNYLGIGLALALR